jgi:hypothetical protein
MRLPCLALTILIALTGRVHAEEARTWLAGDHHVHSRFSGKRAEDGTYVLGKDGIYTLPDNARHARQYGLSWVVLIDHGGEGLSKLRYEQAYPEFLQARQAVPDLIQFFGMELDTPGGDHSSLIMAIDPQEAETLRHLESTYAAHETKDPARDDPARMIAALAEMQGLTPRPLVIANHPSRGASSPDGYGRHTPQSLRRWMDTAPDVAIGMEGAPGHQGASLKIGATPDTLRKRGYYEQSPTYGGFDAMTARLGGVWDALLGEGRHFVVTATSDSHRNVADGGEDFWPGQYAKTWVKARKDPADILDGLRKGRVFVATGDLVSELDMDVAGAQLGDTAEVKKGQTVRVSVRLRTPAGPNAHGDHPQLKRVDLIMGDVTGQVAERNPTTRVVKSFTPADWTREGEVITLNWAFTATTDAYLRLRGTATDEAEPLPDPLGENPWPDLWVYGSPVYIQVR